MKKRDYEQAAQYQQSLTAAKTPSAAETQAEKDRASFFQWRDAGDYRTPAPTMIGLSYGPAAMKRRELEQTAMPTGAEGMGASYANPTALALNKQNLADHNAENDANTYQGAINDEYAYQRTGNSTALMAQDFARKMGLLGDTSSMAQFGTNARIQTQPKSIMPMLLSGLLGAAGQAGAAYLTGGFSAGRNAAPGASA